MCGGHGRGLALQVRRRKGRVHDVCVFGAPMPQMFPAKPSTTDVSAIPSAAIVSVMPSAAAAAVIGRTSSSRLSHGNRCSLAQPANRNPSDGLCMRTSVGLAPSTSSLHSHPLHRPHLHPPPSSSHPSTGTNHTAAGAASSPQLQTATRNPLPHRLPKARGGGRRPKSAGGPAK